MLGSNPVTCLKNKSMCVVLFVEVAHQETIKTVEMKGGAKGPKTS